MADPFDSFSVDGGTFYIDNNCDLKHVNASGDEWLFQYY